MPAKNDVVVLTYNVCFGCMSNDVKIAKRDTASQPLARMCAEAGDDRCLKSVAKAIDSVGPVDFVLLQEATRHRAIAKASTTLSRMQSVACKVKMEECVTFVSPAYNILQSVHGDLAATSSDGGRAFQVIVCERDGHTYIVVNCHNGQSDNSGRYNMQTKLSAALDKVSRNLRISSASTSVLVGGDFNDRGRFNFWEDGGFRPFKLAKVHTGVKNKRVTMSHKPPRTCCDPSGRPGASNAEDIGDYIMGDEAYNVRNVVVRLKAPASDHLPVLARMRATQQPTKGGGALVWTRSVTVVTTGCMLIVGAIVVSLERPWL